MVGDTGRNRVFHTVQVAGFAMWLGGIYLYEAVPSYGTVDPELQTGRVYEINNHGDRHDVTFADFDWIKGLEFGGVLMMAAPCLRRRRDQRW
jgi:hypothetical protein